MLWGSGVAMVNCGEASIAMKQLPFFSKWVAHPSLRFVLEFAWFIGLLRRWLMPDKLLKI